MSGTASMYSVVLKEISFSHRETLPSLRVSLRWRLRGGILKEKKPPFAKEEKMKWMVTVFYRFVPNVTLDKCRK
jgi:hypothetical protein